MFNKEPDQIAFDQKVELDNGILFTIRLDRMATESGGDITAENHDNDEPEPVISEPKVEEKPSETTSRAMSNSENRINKPAKPTKTAPKASEWTTVSKEKRYKWKAKPMTMEEPTEKPISEYKIKWIDKKPAEFLTKHKNCKNHGDPKTTVISTSDGDANGEECQKVVYAGPKCDMKYVDYLTEHVHGSE